jgi:hypothetical protein
MSANSSILMRPAGTVPMETSAARRQRAGAVTVCQVLQRAWQRLVACKDFYQPPLEAGVHAEAGQLRKFAHRKTPLGCLDWVFADATARLP